MLSSADLNLERVIFITALIIFLGAGLLCTLIVYMVNSIRKKNIKGRYYFLLFLISGAVILGLVAFYVLYDVD
jgi:hypothetical protein